MENKNDATRKVVWSLLIGGLVGVGAVYCIHAAKNHKTPVLKKIGKAISDMGEMIENFDPQSLPKLVEKIEDNTPRASDVMSNLAEWVDTGLDLWKKFQQG